ncbi:hypothetical protein A2837_02130 [Candidatus Kaiserbacteria bacterium RIFCSPHIGHO2_01_FULL_46_22]|uniref:RNA polymerase alpha subunit C-terminal domain-containing protein n=1 Tax=Candidatus Kaiserbacteria bacterium RIFCSPHIGHO2_01_FULL_46_22 TaxID=1798475 RepID=A0A1F6BYF6_9BACT|nr:MAG: hypothetical protein A2837_02130 [Candidatus Kaiserbacteria bacterium RIFCSPHIGHO2_01_FULL_46_22]
MEFIRLFNEEGAILTVEPIPLETKLDDVPEFRTLTVRTVNSLKTDNITTVGELAEKYESELLRLTNFGRKSLTEVKAMLAAVGHQLSKAP